MPSGPALCKDQDWTPVVWTKSTKPKQTTHHSGPSVLEENPETFHHAQVTHEFRQALQQARLAKKMSQADLARILNVTPRAVQDYESGSCVPKGAFIAQLNAALGVTLPRLSKPKKSET
jgi:ribosome-binding protein aMBF1 (putative translation factor)